MIRGYLAALSVVMMFAAVSCGSGGGSNAIFSGDLQVTQGGYTTAEPIDLVLNSGKSSAIGSIFRKSDGTVLTMTGSADNLHVTAPPPNAENYTGTLTLGSGSASISLSGSNSAGAVTANGSLTQIDEMNLAGAYEVTETFTYTIAAGGQSQTNTVMGSGIITLSQSGNSVQYTVPMTNVLRTGTITGNSLALGGDFVEISSSDATLTSNSVSISVDISNEYVFSATGQGFAAGSVNGIPFTITGTAKATLTRRFYVAVAVLNGGSISSSSDKTADPNIDALRAQAVDPKFVTNPSLVLAKWFSPGSDQSDRVAEWLDQLFNSTTIPSKIFLIGHSLGGDAVRQFTAPVDTRMAIDPINFTMALTQWNQRQLTFTPAGSSSRFLCILSDANANPLWPAPAPFGLIGYTILPTTAPYNNVVETGTNHVTVLDAVASQGIVASEVNLLLGAAETETERVRKQPKPHMVNAVSAIIGGYPVASFGIRGLSSK